MVFSSEVLASRNEVLAVGAHSVIGVFIPNTYIPFSHKYPGGPLNEGSRTNLFHS